MNSRDGKSQRREEKRREEERSKKRKSEDSQKTVRRKSEESQKKVRRKSEESQKKVRRKSEESQKKEGAGARKGSKVAKHYVIPMICGSGGWKVGSLKWRCGAMRQMRDEKLHPVAARRTCPSQNVQSSPCSDQFWKLRCRKSARRCGAKHIWNSKCKKHTILGPLLEVEIMKKCTPLWHKAHFEVKMF